MRFAAGFLRLGTVPGREGWSTKGEQQHCMCM